MNYIDFIIPTKGRKTLGRSIESILSQTIQDFRVLVVFDGVDIDEPIKDNRVIYLKAPLTKSPGLTRNFAFSHVNSKWIGFLDDDDVLYEKYIEELKKEDVLNPTLAFVLFRMVTSKITPKLEIKDEIVFNETGISFAVKSSVLNRSKIVFDAKGSEDYVFLKSLANKNYTFKISDYIAYEVCRNNRDKEIL
jgi:glycosyltransferase involved in cell wall biosynthesis